MISTPGPEHENPALLHRLMASFGLKVGIATPRYTSRSSGDDEWLGEAEIARKRTFGATG